MALVIFCYFLAIFRFSHVFCNFVWIDCVIMLQYVCLPGTIYMYKERYGPGLTVLEYLKCIDDEFLHASNQSAPLVVNDTWMVPQLLPCMITNT